MSDPNVTQMLQTDPNRTQMIGAPNINATQTIQPVQCPVCKTFNPAGCIYCNECGLVFSMSGDLGEDVFGAPAVRLPCLVEDSGREHFLRPGTNLVGREGDVLLTDSQISRKHAEIRLENGRIILKDLGSTNGTYISDEKLEPQTEREIETGAKLRFGSTSVVLSVPGEMKATLLPGGRQTQMLDAPSPSEPPIAFLVSGENEWALKTGENSIGRKSSNDIQLDDPYASGSHGQITVTDTEISFSDLGSTNGTLLNGAKLPPNEAVRITPDDEIVIGNMTLKIRMGE